ncbi:protein-disulfide reductase DsbD domain-containing protein [Pseudoprimorskyibacter insulae]|uniref:Thiol:disulfide interchange protein DsbD N-terminal domain-containing protein n=1 Tax=Pseudoprimorskyibacter insulae TaxID=1695997 RepID=A0A2R8ANF9_9RHOB|nr:protein-disulfide reductase DsbD domain-containing protein [Pseudoprimorskyibacter insulae]SPF77565.1 hypothetical protein PRI8871_00148 [Pseudoprimorskyibacter insulae]
MIRKLLAPLVLALGLPLPASAEMPMAEIAVRPGWRTASGDHIAALHITLGDGWKTYWRAPGDAGIPPVFDWSGSANAGDVMVVWPTPDVFYQAGMRSVGYKHEVVLPLVIDAETKGDITLSGQMLLGICKDICMPYEARVTATLPAAVTRPDPVIAAAMSEVPFTRNEAGVRGMECQIAPTPDGVQIKVAIDLPKTGGREETVIETSNPMLWVDEPATERRGRTLFTEALIAHADGKPFALDRSGIRVTVLGKSFAVDVQGCD